MPTLEVTDEFEAVFFIGIDQLAERLPELFDKYLYVGTTRAATYLGVTCAGKRLPDRIATLEASFGDSWCGPHGLNAVK
jgi:UvrD-like helicase C-terminal domain